ncbi:Putative short-chain dehydrogenase/reductase OS=Tsukamurella paurometabola (strain ATCC 8368 / DSM / CCUG 35730 / CIP 100753 / JCM 10117 / KCTC 9821 / NBRC 16120 / NCIMB 702349 / NCTC 13040) OX=521096 GN=Tpau_3161 PE=4 SV=1 [Tsukamurella paurometabola]|uniref:Putative short-chain dehydrogenase/reductase n=1 Tax=Tsukamurella paurometabola (strain ATCC 8368 / DSM 20162 / CCUG 35730 / CIP 100753 / JCM 10117 / KCTC 9821 / NBRC 16120 / NCIMB 702349 / NCTC 13040) TaxID=521096 RepID=D5UV30_TSUPD|nr:hypothetical protein [Tsukamurella paurometabola]ADG79748.1 putative short-chain dehydrogenase/reductase [Tsukamurella paurometabola DSM 20162]SUP37037.1 Uncharacterised protein [Tsukamurella paurometabola]
MENVSVKSVVVVLDGTKATVELVGDLTRAGTRVTAVGENFRDVVAVLSGEVYALVADLSDPEQWDTALLRAEQRHGAVEQVLDPAGRLAPVAA